MGNNINNMYQINLNINRTILLNNLTIKILQANIHINLQPNNLILINNLNINHTILHNNLTIKILQGNMRINLQLNNKHLLINKRSYAMRKRCYNPKSRISIERI